MADCKRNKRLLRYYEHAVNKLRGSVGFSQFSYKLRMFQYPRFVPGRYAPVITAAETRSKFEESKLKLLSVMKRHEKISLMLNDILKRRNPCLGAQPLDEDVINLYQVMEPCDNSSDEAAMPLQVGASASDMQLLYYDHEQAETVNCVQHGAAPSPVDIAMGKVDDEDWETPSTSTSAESVIELKKQH